MFTNETLEGRKRAPREQGSEQEVEAIKKKAIKLKLFIYNKSIHDSIIKMLKAGAKTPSATIGKITAEIMAKFEKDGGEIINDPEVFEGLTKALIKELITLAVGVDVLSKEQVNEQMLFSIVGIAQARWEKMNPDRADKGRSQRMLAQGQQNPTMQDAVNTNAQQQAMRPAQQQAAPQAQPMPAQPMPQGQQIP